MRGNNNAWWIVLLCSVFALCKKKEENNSINPPPPSSRTFTNPLVTGSDPWVVQRDTTYYYTHTLGNRIALWRTNRMSALANASRDEVYFPVGQGTHSANIWAPELHLLDDKWYVYYTAGAGPDSTQRIWVFENESSDPFQGQWVDKGKFVTGDTDMWSIDATIMEYNGDRYALWSGRPDLLKQQQNIYISRMADPYSSVGEPVLLSLPEFEWEKNGDVNEAPQIVKGPKGEVVLFYSASGCWTDEYCIGMLSLSEGGNPLSPDDWIKSDKPVFVKKPSSMAYGPGHNAFFKSRNNEEYWMIYHANSNTGEGCGEMRNVRMQRFTWTDDGVPQLGEPVAPGSALEVPGGE